MNSCGERLKNGLIDENPIFVLMLGMCPTLAVTTSAMNGIGMGLGFTVGLLAIGAVREIIGAGQIFGKQILPLADSTMGKAGYTPITIFILAPGAFLVLAGLAAIQNKVKINMEKKGKDASKIQSGCGSDCATCAGCASTADKGKE